MPDRDRSAAHKDEPVRHRDVPGTVSVTVTPQTFNFVAYDAALIQRVAEELLSSLGMGDRNLHIEIDETTPLSRTRVEIGDTISIRAESGALEDTKRPRQQSEVATATSIGRALLRVRDRLNGGFGEAPPDTELSLAQVEIGRAHV